MILDTNAVSALLAGDAALARILEPEPRHHVPTVVLGEYRYGLLRSRQRERLAPLLDLLEQESVVLMVDEGTARSYSLVRDELRRRGKPIPENDVWIAALARQHELSVVSRDGHFDDVPGLERVTW